MSERERKHKLFVQRIIGLLLLAISAFVVVWASHGTSWRDSGVDGLFIVIPIALICLFSKDIVITGWMESDTPAEETEQKDIDQHKKTA